MRVREVYLTFWPSASQSATPRPRRARWDNTRRSGSPAVWVARLRDVLLLLEIYSLNHVPHDLTLTNGYVTDAGACCEPRGSHAVFDIRELLHILKAAGTR